MFYRFNYILACTVITLMLGIWIFSLSFTTPKNTIGKLEIPFPRDKGMGETTVTDPILEEIRVSMEWDAGAGKTKLWLGENTIKSFSGIEEVIQKVVENGKKDGGTPISDPVLFYGDTLASIPAVINAAPDVPWQDVVSAINICKKHGIGVLFTDRYVSPDEPNEYEEEDTRPRLTGKEYIEWRDKVKVKWLEIPMK